MVILFSQKNGEIDKGQDNTNPKYRLGIVKYDLYYNPETGEIEKVEHPDRDRIWIKGLIIK